MSPPSKEGDQAIRNLNGINPSTPIPENSIEKMLLNIQDRYSRVRYIEHVLIAYYGKSLESSQIESHIRLDVFQDSLKRILVEHDNYIKMNKDNISGILVRNQYLSELVSHYFSAVFFQLHPPNLSELDFRLLNECIRRFNEDREPKSFSDLCFHMQLDEVPKAANFLRFAFSANVDKDLRKSARVLLNAISDKCTLSGTKTVMVKGLRRAKNNFEKDKGGTGEIERNIEEWLTSS